MGMTCFPGYSKQDVIDHVTRAHETEHCRYTTVATYISGDVLWAVVELVATVDGFRGLASWQDMRIIACYVLDRGSTGWGHKDIEEFMHPYHYSCPLQFLEMAPEKHPEWRAKVRSWHARPNNPNAGKLVDDQLRVMRICNAHMLSLEAFACRATALRNKTVPRKWSVFFGEAKWKNAYDEIHRDLDQPFIVGKFKPEDSRKKVIRTFDFDYAFSDAETEEDAIRSVHWGAVNNALLAHTPEGRRMDLVAFPSSDVLALYPDLVEKFPDAFQGRMF